MKSQLTFLHFHWKNAFDNVVWKMTAILSRPQCVKQWHAFYVLLCPVNRYLIHINNMLKWMQFGRMNSARLIRWLTTASYSWNHDIRYGYLIINIIRGANTRTGEQSLLLLSWQSTRFRFMCPPGIWVIKMHNGSIISASTVTCHE